MSDLSAEVFSQFYEAVHGHAPFPWQRDLVDQVLCEGRWPDLVDVPTGLGKTSMLDVAVFVAAATVTTPGEARPGRRRVVFVVDRRIVVDEAFTHAKKLSAALTAAEDTNSGAVSDVAEALRRYAPHAQGELLPVTRMRGGATWDTAWLDRPDRPAIVLGTVDQVGSRLLFRGYGVSDRRRPIDAALVGADCLLLVDEAHLSSPLLTTVTAVQERDSTGSAGAPLPVPGVSVVRLTATGDRVADVFALDVEEHRKDALAWARLTAGKRLHPVMSNQHDIAQSLAEVTMTGISDLGSAAGWAPCALVVCNTVDRARAVHSHLLKLLAGGEGGEADCELLIGRARPVDRPHLQDRLLARFGTGRQPSQRPAVLVATQTVEVGINLDADLLVTESASWEALVQRLGRLNRLGEFPTRFPARAHAEAFAVHDGREDGPVYGASRDATWARLVELTYGESDGLGVSPLECRSLSGSQGFDPLRCHRPQVGVPVLQVPTLDAWTQTAPVPLNDTPIEPFLHGFDSGAPGVLVAWRSGLLLDGPFGDPFDESGAEHHADEVATLIDAVPIRAGEQMEVPFIAVRQWMSGRSPAPVSDVEGAPDVEGPGKETGEPFRVLACRANNAGADRRTGAATAWRWIEHEQLRPGDQIVVPVERGGLDEFGWDPGNKSQARDVSEAAGFAPSRSGRSTGVLRLDASLGLRLALADEDASAVGQAVAALTGAVPDDLTVRDTHPGQSAGQAAQEWARTRAEHLCVVLRDRLSDLPAEQYGWSHESWARLRVWLQAGPEYLEVMTAPAALEQGIRPSTVAHLMTGPIHHVSSREPGLSDCDDDDVASSSIGSGPVTLDQHHEAVRARAQQIAAAMSLGTGLVEVVADAAGWHDLGKVDQRFQAMLHGGDATEAAIAPQPLAKSGMDRADRMAWRRARSRAGLPPGARHEAWSAALVQDYLRQRDTPYPGDGDLLIHLVASHHGHARPLAPLVVDTAPRPLEAVIAGTTVTAPSNDTVDLDHPARFERLNARYGRWGLALLESIVRCADMTVSSEGS